MTASRMRWGVRKTIRGGAARAASACGLVAVRRRLAVGPRVRAITYHRFGDAPRDPWVVAREAFDAQMAWLAASGLAVSLDDVLSFVRGRRDLQDGAVLVTIDDGCLSTLREAVPILRRHGVPAATFVSAGLIGSSTAAADHGERYLDWDELAAVRDAGVEIGSHAFDHRSLARLAPAEARDQARRSRDVLEERLGGPVRSFAYPFGMHADFDAGTDRLLAEAGYAIAFHSLHGAIGRGMPPISLPRVKIEAGEGMTMFRLSCRGAMDVWRLVDDGIARLRRTRPETAA